MSEPVVAPATQTLDPADFQAYHEARKKVDTAKEWMSANPAKAENPAAEKPPEISSEPAGDEPVKVEAKPEPEAGAKQEQEPKKENEPRRAHSPGWYRRDLKEKEREIRALEAKLAERPTPAPAAAPAPAALPAAQEIPEFREQRDDEGYGVYITAQASYYAKETAKRETQQGIMAFQQKVNETLQSELREAALATHEEQWAAKVESAKAHYKDYDDVVFGDDGEAIPAQFAREIEALPNGGHVAYHLSSNPAEQRRIFSLPPYFRAVEYGKLEAKFSNVTKAAPETKTRSNGTPKPTPITPIGGGNSAAAIDDPNDPLVAEDLHRWRRAKESASRR